LAPTIFEEQSDIVDAVQDDEVARFVITVGEAQHTYVFSHQRLREVFLEEIYAPRERAQLQQRLISYGDAWYRERSGLLPDYIRQFWISHLQAAGAWQRIRDVLTEMVAVGGSDGSRLVQPWQSARFAAEGSDTGYLEDLDRLWRWAEEQRDVGLALRCALIEASLRSRSGNLFPELLVQLVQVGTTEGKWSAVAALEQIAQMPEAEKQVACIEALLSVGVVFQWSRAMMVARTITDERSRAKALRALAPHLPSDMLPEALAAARAITNEYYRAEGLTALVPHLPSEMRPEALAADRTITNW